MNINGADTTMRPDHPFNLECQPYPHWRVILLAWIGKALGVQFQIEGLPFGSGRRPRFDENVGIGLGHFQLGAGSHDDRPDANH